MSSTEPPFLVRCLTSALRGTDYLFSGCWWWKLRRLHAEKRLGSMLDRYATQSMQVRRATERYREMHFAVTYWRTAPGPVRQIVLAASKAGAPLGDLRLIVLNADLKLRRGIVELRRSALLRPLMVTATGVVIAHWAMVSTLVILQPGPKWLQALMIAMVSAFDFLFYRGWSLWLGRPLSAIKRSGPLVDQACRSATHGKLATFPPRPNQNST